MPLLVLHIGIVAARFCATTQCRGDARFEESGARHSAHSRPVPAYLTIRALQGLDPGGVVAHATHEAAGRSAAIERRCSRVLRYRSGESRVPGVLGLLVFCVLSGDPVVRRCIEAKAIDAAISGEKQVSTGT